MNILMVNKFLHPKGGAETYLFQLGEYLEKAGHCVQYFGMEHENRCVGNAVGAYTSTMDFHGGLTPVKLLYPVKTIYSVEASQKIQLVLKNFQPDVVHLNNFNYQLTPSIILAIVKWRKSAGKKCRIVFTAHDYNLICPNHLLYNPVKKTTCEKCLGGHFWNCARGKCIHGSFAKSAVGAMEALIWNRNGVYRYLDAIICCSEFLKKKMDTNPLFSNKTVAMHNFIPHTTSMSAKKKDYVLYFGRFSPEKGIQMLASICRELPDVRFVFAGSGPLESILAEIPNAENVGFQSGDALKTLIREARFSVCPSVSYENCPLSVLESIECGTPVLGANIGGIPELIDVGKTGMLFRAGDAEDLKAKIRYLLETPGLLAQYADNCKKADIQTPESYLKKLIQIYTNRYDT